MREDRFDIVYRLLDDELVDSDGRRCGRVDDLEIEGQPGEPAHIAAIVCGPGAWSQRLPRRLGAVIDRLFGSDTLRIPWSEVADLTEVVTLKKPRDELGAGRGDDEISRVVGKLPGA
jgi:sporulation protein YlmC with PRC-barrel domain